MMRNSMTQTNAMLKTQSSSTSSRTAALMQILSRAERKVVIYGVCECRVILQDVKNVMRLCLTSRDPEPNSESFTVSERNKFQDHEHVERMLPDVLKRTNSQAVEVPR